jgi:hypothetical protein
VSYLSLHVCSYSAVYYLLFIVFEPYYVSTVICRIAK